MAVSASLSGTADASGAVVSVYSVPPNQAFTLERLAATGTSTTAPELRVYRNGTLIDGTGNANADTSELSVQLFPGDVLRAEWAKATPGALLTLVAEGSGE